MPAGRSVARAEEGCGPGLGAQVSPPPAPPPQQQQGSYFSERKTLEMSAGLRKAVKAFSLELLPGLAQPSPVVKLGDRGWSTEEEEWPSPPSSAPCPIPGTCGGESLLATEPSKAPGYQGTSIFGLFLPPPTNPPRSSKAGITEVTPSACVHL